jgi:hypothetical protein
VSAVRRAWDANDRGRYRIRANSRAVRDVAGNAAERRAIGVFDVSTLAILPATSALGRATDATGDGDPRNARLADELPA